MALSVVCWEAGGNSKGEVEEVRVSGKGDGQAMRKERLCCTTTR